MPSFTAVGTKGSTSFGLACDRHYGGHIERLIGTIVGELHLLPGTSFGNPIKHGSYDAKNIPPLREHECYLGWEIAGGYHERIHSSLMRSPLAIWREHEERVRSPVFPPWCGSFVNPVL